MSNGGVRAEWNVSTDKIRQKNSDRINAVESMISAKKRL